MNANAGAAVAPTNSSATTKVRIILRMAHLPSQLCSHCLSQGMLPQGQVLCLLSRSNFFEPRQGEVRRIPLPHTRVHRAVSNAPRFLVWQHDFGCFRNRTQGGLTRYV